MIINRGPTAAEINAYIAGYGVPYAHAWLSLMARGSEHFLPREHRCWLGYAAVWLKVCRKHLYGVLALTQKGRTIYVRETRFFLGHYSARHLPMFCGVLMRLASKGRGRTRQRMAGNELDIGRPLERLRLLQDDLFGFVADACEPCSFQLINGQSERGARFKASVDRLKDYRLRVEVARCASLPKPRRFRGSRPLPWHPC